MLSKIRILFILPLILLVAGTAYAQNPRPQHSEQFWRVTFWNNTSLSGQPVLTAAHESIDWDWGHGSPNTSIQDDQFSGRWSRYIEEYPGTYRFTVTSDDGVRLYIDNQLVINEWREQPASTFVADVPLTAGHHHVVVEYYESGGLARLKLNWRLLPMPEPIQFWRGEYYDNSDLRGMPVLVRDDHSIDFNWGSGSPGSVVPKDRFSARWTRTLNLEPGEYEFTPTSDDGVRLWVNGHLLIDQWREQPATTYMGKMYVSGSTSVKMEYFENGGEAVARLFITAAGGGPPPPPPPPNPMTVVVDDEGAGFVKAGDDRFWRSASDGYGGQMTWTRNNDHIRPKYNWARWYPELDAARYEVFVHIPAHNATTRQARYWVSHYDGYSLRVVNQGATSGWLSLGTYRFRGDGRDYVSLADVTFEPYLSQQIGFDAVKWVRR